MRIAALLPSHTAILRLRDSLPTRTDPASPALEFHDRWDALITEGEAGRFDTCVVDPCFGGAARSPEVHLDPSSPRTSTMIRVPS